MSEPKFKVGDPVFIIEFLHIVPGDVVDAVIDYDGNWNYAIRTLDSVIKENIKETALKRRLILEPPKYKKGDIVSFKNLKGEEYKGKISVVDPYGTLEQDKEPSYDILVEGDTSDLFKHIRESWIIEE